jgi:hypothetical protein
MSWWMYEVKGGGEIVAPIAPHKNEKTEMAPNDQ